MGKFIDLTGQRFGRLTVIEKTGHRDNKGQIIWKCQCDCGNIVDVCGSHLRCGHTKSCGCLKRNYKHGESNTRLHHIWSTMLYRIKPQHRKHAHYYDKGIKVCEEWRDYTVFADWARTHGYNDQLTIDRIDVNGNYCPENCRWVSYKVQGNNKSNNVRITYCGQTKTLSEWSDITGINYQTLMHRYKKGCSEEQLFAEPIKR